MRTIIGLTAFALLFAIQAQAANAETWTGTLIDTKCYSMTPKNAGMDHVSPNGKIKNCASACAKMGIPAAILVKGKVLTLAAPAPSFASSMAKTATVTGKRMGDLIVPMKVVVDGKELNISGMM